MEKANFGQIVSFLFGIANDCLVDTYDVGDYRKIILPMMVIRRFDAVLEPTKEKVLKMKEQLDAAGITDQDEALCSVAGEAFCNSSPYTLSDLKSRTNQQQLKSDFILYLNGFSQNVQDIIKRFEFRNQIDKLSEHDILGLLISKFTDSSVNLSNRPIYDAKGNLVQPALDNHTMGTVFEEVIRKFNEETNITDAGRHFTPRDIVELITDLAFVPVKGKIQSTTYRIYDGACGTGGMLTVAEGRMQEMAKEFGKNVSIHLYGQENSDETYAIARSDMLVKGEGVQANNIFFGSTISNDGFSGETFDFMLSNPPFGTPWKTDLKAWGDIKKDEITDTRFRVNYKGEDFSLIPDIGDPQMLFLANNISKMKKNTVLGSRIVEVHNSSSLSTGKAGSGPSNLRQYTSNSFETRQDHFVCSTSRKKGKEVCDTHFIRAVVLEEGTLQHMRLVIQCVADYEDAFRRALGAKRSEEAKKDLSAKKRTLQKSENRLAELDRLFKRIYEDMVNGKLSETRFQMLADDYEQEQADLRAKIEMLENEIQNQEDQAENVDRFIRQAKKYLYLEKLTPTILNDMVNAVYVHAPDKSSGHRVQDVTISYNYIGILPANLLYDVMNGKAA